MRLVRLKKQVSVCLIIANPNDLMTDLLCFVIGILFVLSILYQQDLFDYFLFQSQLIGYNRLNNMQKNAVSLAYSEVLAI